MSKRKSGWQRYERILGTQLVIYTQNFISFMGKSPLRFEQTALYKGVDIHTSEIGEKQKP
jgi:hypothetical protein